MELRLRTLRKGFVEEEPVSLPAAEARTRPRFRTRETQALCIGKTRAIWVAGGVQKCEASSLLTTKVRSKHNLNKQSVKTEFSDSLL
jgi:hypothetical protein